MMDPSRTISASSNHSTRMRQYGQTQVDLASKISTGWRIACGDLTHQRVEKCTCGSTGAAGATRNQLAMLTSVRMAFWAALVAICVRANPTLSYLATQFCSHLSGEILVSLFTAIWSEQVVSVAADLSSLDAWLVERDLPPDLGATLREQGYTAPEALYTIDGSSVLSEKQLKDWGVLPWHRRKYLAAVAHQAEERRVPEGSPAATDHGDFATSDPAKDLLASQERVRESQEAPQEESPQAPAASLVAEAGDRHSSERDAIYTAKIAPQFRKPGRGLVSLADTEAALGLLLDVRQHASSHPIVSGVVVSGPAHQAGVLLGSKLLAVNGRAAAVASHPTEDHPPVNDTALIEMVQDAVSNSAATQGSQIELSLQSPGPLSATSPEVATDAVTPAAVRSSGKRSKRRGKREAVTAKKKKKQKRGQRGDTTERFHAALQGLRDIPLAEAMLEASITAAAAAAMVQEKKERHVDDNGVRTNKDIIDFGRRMELPTMQGPRPESAGNHQEDSVRAFRCALLFQFRVIVCLRIALGGQMVQLPVVQAILRQFNQMPLRFRPPAALRLAQRLVTEADAPVGGDADIGSDASALDYAALLKATGLLRSLLRTSCTQFAKLLFKTGTI
jgi:hypothetical protein